MSNSTQTKYFDLHTRGIGYVSRIREVTPKKGAAFVACTIAALTGSSDSVEYRYFDTTVVGSEAISLIKRCQDAVASDSKVLVSFNIGDLWIDPFVYQQGPKKGETGHSLKGRLLAIDWIKIDGEVVYSKPAQSEHESESDNPAANSSSDEGVSSLAYTGDGGVPANDDEYVIYTDEAALSQTGYVPDPAQHHKLNKPFDSLVTD